MPKAKTDGGKVAEAPTDARIAFGTQIADETALREATFAAQVNRASKVKPDAEGDIDQRMAAVLKDHQDMGARPK